MAHGQGIRPHEGGPLRPQQIAFHRGAADGVGAVQDHHLFAQGRRGLHHLGQGGGKGVDPGAHVLHVHQDRVHRRQGLGRRRQPGPVEADHRQLQDRVDKIGRGDHIVLLFPQQAVLRAEQDLQLPRKAGRQEFPGAGQIRPHRGRVAQEAQPGPRRPGRGVLQKDFQTR